MLRIGLVLICCSVFFSKTSANGFPSDVQRCKYADNECLRSTVTDILRSHYKGHRGLNLIPFDPLHLKSLVLERLPNSPVNVEFKFHDIDLSGLSKATVTKLTGFTKEATDLVFELHADIPRIELNGPYKIDGRVLILPIVGEGNSKIVFENIVAKAKAKCTTVEKDGKTYLNIVNVVLDLQPKHMVFNLQNLFNGNTELGDNMNLFLNENWEVVYSEMKPVVVEALAKIALHIANGTFSKIPYADLFLSSE